MLTLLKETAFEAGHILMKYYRNEVHVQDKTSQHNIVTVADLESQNFIHTKIVNELSKKMPEDEIGFIGEEGLAKKGKYTFVIDPIDGTSNYACGMDYFAVSIGVFKEEILTYAMVYMPIFKTFYYAEKGKGAYKEVHGEKIRLEMKPLPLRNQLFTAGISADVTKRHRMFKMMDSLFPHFRGYASILATVPSFCKLADNAIGLHFAGTSGMWDIAAVKLIVEESGGVMTDWKGNEIQFNFNDPFSTYSALACHPQHLAQILDLIK